MNVSLQNFIDAPRSLQLESRDWRNSPQVSSFFRIPNIDEATHVRWLQSLLCSPPRVIAFFIQCDSIPVGVTYFSRICYAKKRGDWGIYIKDDAYRGRGVGRIALKSCILYAKDVLGLSRVELDVLPTNLRAISMYKACGFSIENASNDIIRMTLDL